MTEVPESEPDREAAEAGRRLVAARYNEAAKQHRAQLLSQRLGVAVRALQAATRAPATTVAFSPRQALAVALFNAGVLPTLKECLVLADEILAGLGRMGFHLTEDAQ